MFLNATLTFVFFFLTLSVFIDCLSSNQTLTEQLPKESCSTRKRPLTPLEKYVFDDSDLDYVNYEVLSIWNTSTYTTYKLNATTLKWFDGKHLNSYFVNIDSSVISILKKNYQIVLYGGMSST
jgi:hypothetical protein